MPIPNRIGVPPADIGAQAVAFQSASGSMLSGWLGVGRGGAGVVVLLHGIGANRLAMLDRARFLHAVGYSVLLIDFRAHGESTGDGTTYGALESLDAKAAVDFVHARLPAERVGVIGVSMGGAAALLGPGPLHVDALVLESVYPSIDQAVSDRLRTWLWPVGAFVAAPLASVFTEHVLPWRSVQAADLRPIDRIPQLDEPVFVLAGTRDPYTTIAESKALFARAPEPKWFWGVEGAGHDDLHGYAPEEYERRVRLFLDQYLRIDDGQRREETAVRDVPPVRPLESTAVSYRTREAMPF